MSSMDLGTARGRIILDPSGAVAGAAKAQAATAGLMGSIRRVKPVTDKVGKGMLVMGGLAAAGIGVAVNTAADFEQKMNKVGAVSGATGKEFEDLSGLAKELGTTTQFSASQAAEGMSFLAMAGFDTKEVMSAMPGVLDLAAAGNMELARASDIASNVLTGYGLEAGEINRVNDTMAATASSANTSVEQLGQAMSFVAPVANASGLAIEETSAVIGKLSDAGIQGSRAGTTLRQIIAKLEKPTTQGAEAIERLGIKTHDAEGQLLSMTEIVKNFEDAGLSTADAMTIFGARAGPGMQALVDQGSAGLERLNGELAESQGRAKEMAERQMEGLNGAMTEFKSAIEGALIAVGEQLTPFLEKVADAVTRVVQGFAKLPGPVQKAIAIAGVATAVFGIFGGMALLIIGRIPAMAAGFKTLGITMKGALIGTGIGAVIIAIAAGLYLLYQNSETFRQAVASLWERIQGVVDVFKDLGRRLGLFRKYMQNGADASTAFQYAFSAVLPQGVVDAVTSFIDFIKNAWPQIQAAIQEFIGWAQANILPFWNHTFGQIKEIARNALDALVAIFTFVFAIIRNVVRVFVDVVTGFWQRFGTHILSAAMGMLKTLIGFFKGTFQNIKQFIDGVLRVISGIFDVFAGLFTGDWSRLWGGIQKIFTGIWSAIHAFLSQIMQTIISVFRVAFEIMRTLIGAAMAAISQIWSAVWSKIVNYFRDTWSRIRNFFSGQINKIKSEIRTALSFIQNVWNRAWNAVSGFVSRAWNKITSAVRSGARTMMDFIRGLPSRILRGLGNLGRLLYSAGKDILKGLVDGIKSVASAPVDAVKGVVSSVRNLLPFSPAKEGPLRDNPPDEAGRAIGAMLAQGIEDSIRAVRGAAFSLADTATISGMRPAAAGAMNSTRNENINLNGDLVLPNVRNGDDAQELLDGLRQAARQGGTR